MKRIKFFLIALVFAPFCAHAAQNDFMVAAQLLSAAKNADIQQVQILVNSGADVNFVDATGLSLVCTALMNNDLRAAQILQMYGADASKCDKQIKNYKSKNKKEGGGGLFSGLSTAQGIALAAAGAAVVVGGLLLLTDVFDGGNSNGSGGGSTGDRPGGGGSGNGGNKPTPSFTLPYGPAMPNAESEAKNYITNLDIYSTKGTEEETGNIFYQDFQLMNQLQAVGDDTKTGGQNYLLMMHGYSPWARGYLGQRTLRQSDNTPFSLAEYKLGNDQVGGGLPVNVVLVTENGVNSTAGDTSLKDKIGLYTTQNGTTLNQASKSMIFSKYYNNTITCNGGTESDITNCTGAEDSSKISQFDLSGMGSANQNPMATDFDDLLGKIVGGNNSGTTKADYAGFMPNGQMTIYRTGGGWGLVAVGDGGEKKSGNYEMSGDKFAANDSITIDEGTTYTIKDVNQNGVFTAQKDGAGTYVGYVIGQNLYMDTDGDGKIDMAFTMTNNGEKKLTQTMKGQVIDYQNYKALSSALSLTEQTNNNSSGAKSKPDVLANIYVIEPLHATDAATINDILSVKSDSSDSNRKSAFSKYVDFYYDLTSDNSDNVSSTATSFFNSLGSQNHQLVLFSTGASLTDTCNAAGENCTNPLGHWGGAALDATFENAAPLVFNNLEHLFMSIVAVGLSGAGTSGATSVSGFSPESGSKYVLAQWGVKGTDDIKYYRARKCGVAGMGLNGIDPWCFAAAGFTDEVAMASAAGAVGVMKSAFPNLNNTQLFTLLALTADGPFLATDTNGNAFSSVDALESYLKNLFQMPNEDEARWQNGENYLDVFQSVFGYGLINLERATTPGTSVYFYNGTDIVSGSGNAYWRAAANTVFRTSAVFNPRGGSISAPYYDILESVDGELRLPRVWKNEFTLGTQSRRGLYMGDVLGELRTRAATPNRMMIGDIGFSMAMSAKPYADNLGGLDSMQIDYAYGNWNFNAGYQHYLTDGESRFNAMSNPILGLASNAITSDSEYRMGRFAFGARMFSGAITDESLLENDPTIAAQFEPMRLGNMYGAQSYVAWDNGKFGFSAAVGNVRETNTLLGAMTGGLLDLGNGNTVYVDSELRWAPIENVNLRMRSTFARTTSDASGQFIMGLTPIESNAFALGVDVGAFGFTAAMPLAITSGAMKYAYADYDVVEVSSGKYDLVVRDARVAQLGLTPVARELRFTGTYRHKLGEFTDGAIGFIYRVNPNNTNEFGNESIFMMKLSHRIGI